MTEIQTLQPRGVTTRYYHYDGASMSLGTAERFSEHLQRFGVSMTALAQQHRTWITSGQTASKPSLNIYNQAPQPAPEQPATQEPAEAAARVNDALERLWDIGRAVPVVNVWQIDWLEGQDAKPAHTPTMSGTDGDDEMHINASQANTGAGNDTAYVYNNAQVQTGEGDDKAVLYSNSTVHLGEGDNHALIYSNGHAIGGSGEDEFTLLRGGQAHGGAGNDKFLAMANGLVYGEAGDDHIEFAAGERGGRGTGFGGEGNDTMITQGDGWVHGDEGNDTLVALGSGKLYGGAGDDILSGKGGFLSVFNGGTGNDTINLLPDVDQNYRIEYNKGDGDDIITGDLSSVKCTTFRFDKGPDGKLVAVQEGPSRQVAKGQIMVGEGIQRDEVTAARDGNDVRVSFGSAGGSITFKDFQDPAPRLTFADGSWLDIKTLLPAAENPAT